MLGFSRDYREKEKTGEIGRIRLFRMSNYFDSQLVGRYLVSSILLGKGVFGDVYRGTDT